MGAQKFLFPSKHKFVPTLVLLQHYMCHVYGNKEATKRCIINSL
jgi:hypothetical protein